jgi:hypothetical protein
MGCEAQKNGQAQARLREALRREDDETAKETLSKMRNSWSILPDKRTDSMM